MNYFIITRGFSRRLCTQTTTLLGLIEIYTAGEQPSHVSVANNYVFRTLAGFIRWYQKVKPGGRGKDVNVIVTFRTAPVETLVLFKFLPESFRSTYISNRYRIMLNSYLSFYALKSWSAGGFNFPFHTFAIPAKVDGVLTDICLAAVQVRRFAERRRVLVRKQVRQVRSIWQVRQEMPRRALADVRRTRRKYDHASVRTGYASKSYFGHHLSAVIIIKAMDKMTSLLSMQLQTALFITSVKHGIFLTVCG